MIAVQVERGTKATGTGPDYPTCRALTFFHFVCCKNRADQAEWELSLKIATKKTLHVQCFNQTSMLVLLEVSVG
jgi:hypothetical protein